MLVRLVVRDDAKQARTAEEFIASGAWISHLVLTETTRVLAAVYERTAEQIATVIDDVAQPRAPDGAGRRCGERGY